MNRISSTALFLEPLLRATEDPRCGGVAIFAGTVRNHHEGRSVVRLNYTAHVALAERLITDIEIETRAKFDVAHCRVVHRVGTLTIGDVAIYAVTRAVHRREAFAACEYVVHAVKHRVPIWKEEFYEDGTSRFVEGCCLAPETSDVTPVASPVTTHA
jgi:molybdopterin synthase catalytic subunit